jgi:phosphoglycolate phosphatase
MEIEMKKYNAFIFDLDGTLLNTLDDLMDSANYALTQMGFPERNRDEVRRFVGNGVQKLIERAVPEGTPEKVMLETLAIFKEHYSHNMINKTGPYEGLIEILKVLKENNIPAGIVSNKFDTAVKELNKLFFSEYIHVAIGESADVAKKPAPDICIKAMSELGIDTANTVYVGDSDVDIQTAQNSGLDCISVTWGFRDREFLNQHGATTIIDSPEELLQYINL